MGVRSAMCGLVMLFALVLGSALPAHAQWTAVPYVGAAFGGQVHDGSRIAVGGSLLRAITPAVAIEADVAWTDQLFRISGITAPLFDQSAVVTAMGNVIVNAPWSWRGRGLQPFGVAGLGIIRSRIGDDDAFIQVRNSHVGLSLGGGVDVHLSERFGLRGDVRYLRDLQMLDSDSEFFSLADTHLSFGRATVGVAFRF